MVRILSVINQKGGCGKTTTAINLAACLVRRGKKVLLVDMDPQGHAAVGMGAADVVVRRDLRSALLTLYEEPLQLAEVVAPVEEGLHVAPSLLSLVALEQELGGADRRERRLKDLLDRGGAAYDYILVDSPPNLGILTINALAAADEILIPVDTGGFSLHGMRRIFQVVDLVEDRMGRAPAVSILMTFYDRRVRLARIIQQQLEEHYPDKLMETRIRSNIHLKEAASYGMPVVRYRPSSLGSWDYQALAEEILAREEQRRVETGRAEAQAAEAQADELEAAGGEAWTRYEGPEDEGRGEQAVVDGLEEGDAGREGKASGESGTRDVVFTVRAPGARQVYVAGEFNNWRLDPSASLAPDEGGVWRGRLSLPPGRYQYRYYVDGRWVVDPENPLRIVTENGVVNSLVTVK